MVSVGSPPAPASQNHQNEPAVAIDAHDPDVLVAGSNDKIDQQPCPRTLAVEQATCEPDNGIGISGVYFSFDRGRHWTQPSYTGLTGRGCGTESPCEPYFGPIGRLPWYYENGLVDAGDPAVAIGPRPVNGRFSWSNGSRVYYSNNTADLADFYGAGADAFRGYQAIGVSRLDNPTRERVAQKSSWMPPVIVSRQNSALLSDKDQIWVDNAASSRYFGNTYVCYTAFRSSGRGNGLPAALMVGASTDGGDAWRVRQISAADANGHGPDLWGFIGCVIRTDSEGVVYLAVGKAQNPAVSGLPTHAEQVLFESFDGGATWTKGRTIVRTTQLCHFMDPLSGRCVIDGYTGARTDGGDAPSLDVANGAPTGADATNLIIDAWSDANAGLNNEQARISWSSDRGRTWHDPVSVSPPGDRPLYAAPAISPSGDRAYVVYEAVTSPWAGSDLSSPRPYHGMFVTAPVTAAGPGSWSTVYDGPLGDLRATFPGHRLREERVGDYIYAAAARGYGVGVWIDARNAEVCPAIQDWRAQSLAAGEPVIPAPWPLADCPARFGNSDVWSATSG